MAIEQLSVKAPLVFGGVVERSSTESTDNRNVDKLSTVPAVSVKTEIQSEEQDSTVLSRIQELKAEQLKELDQRTEEVNQALVMSNFTLQFKVDADQGRSIIKVYDTEKKELIRQIPAEDFLKVADKIRELNEELNSLKGFLYEAQA
ncbi:flagellar protein FlaG [Aliiglaciecola sp. CAU 1673]|uniref:flagellar protein FlaG n=1 Tax=Aliiglaciecola sp. CAU 1673 TaxID=3032595 RepID=UPI0023DC4F81|nr:flagellar protein FlaG [Aliiglaciecola sp. CAU 1673]MDF2178314.1 flagellar protein FlaG [Aliiglaciecola sp. CAU 1673]